jgi:hypothetical protein
MEIIERYGYPRGFLAGTAVDYIEGSSAVVLQDGPIPLDGRVYKCGGEIILKNGRRLPAEIGLNTALAIPFVSETTWISPDDRKMWYQLDEPEFLEVIQLSAADAFPVKWITGRPLRHADRGPYEVSWRHK